MYIDAHTHLDRYQGNPRKIVDEITDHRIFTISNSMDIPSFQQNLILGQMSELILPTFGIHPWNAPEYIDQINELRKYLRNSKLIGEVGLDYHFVEDESAYPLQRRLFEFFLQSAADQNKIIEIHTKGAEHEVLDLLHKYTPLRAIIHWYSGPLDILRDYFDLGVCFTVGVEVLTSEHIQDLVKKLPSHLLLTETDNPGGYEWLFKEAGRPLIIKEVVKKIAALKETSEGNIRRACLTNLIRLFRNDPELTDLYQFLLEGLLS